MNEPVVPPSLVSESSLWDRISNWTANNKAVVYSLGAVIVVGAAGGGWYYYRKSPPPPKATTSTAAAEDREKKKKNKKKKKAGAATPPVPKQEEQAVGQQEINLETATPEEKKAHAVELKTLGNKAYAKGDFTQAIDLYTKAITTDPDPIYYSNRAACFAALHDQESVIADTSEALRLDPTYVKAMNRRAVALEQSNRNSEALLDFTASSILDNFSNENAAQAIERLLKKIAESKAKDILSNRNSRLPSSSFVSAYLDAFRKKPFPEITYEDENMGDIHLKRALLAVEQKEYKDAIDHLNTAISKPFTTPQLEALALNYSATFKFIRAEVTQSMAEITRSLELDPTFTNSLVKRASMHMETADKASTLEDFDRAIAMDPTDPDIYYHRGQCWFILQDFTAASKDYQESIELDDQFVFSHIQLGVAQYKLGNLGASMATFRRCVAKFPRSAEVFNYYGELLLDQGKFEDALDKFDKAIQLERSEESPNVNVMPLINKALALFQWKKDIAQAEELCRKALMLDEESDVALATLSQFLLTQGKAADALQYFEKSAEVARTEAEIINALSYAEATKTQLEVEKRYPDLAARMMQLADQAARAQA